MDEQSSLSVNERRQRYFELVLVFGSVFGSSLLLSLYAVATSATLMPRGVNPALEISHGIFGEIFGLALLVYVLQRRHETLRDLGLTFHWKDVGATLGLAIIGYGTVVLMRTAIVYGWYFWTGHVLSNGPKNLEVFKSASHGWFLFLSIPFVIINPVAEELIARAYVMCEVRLLTGSAITAVLMSAGLQATYHLYQGVVPAITYLALFIVFSIYYARSGRILPVILVHFLFDATSLVSAHLR